MKCPSNDCEAEICQRDIKGLLEDEEWAKFLRNMYERGQFRVPSTHCHTPNCPGWAELVEEKEKQKYFLCSRCSKVNCITCDAQHDKQTCDEYQKEYNDANDLKRNQIKLTEKLIEEIIHVELGMKCAHCSQLIMKKDGCDWIKCKCGLELCWPTKGPRWGPKGHGDTTGGCRCGVDGKKCHQSCANCH